MWWFAPTVGTLQIEMRRFFVFLIGKDYEDVLSVGGGV